MFRVHPLRNAAVRRLRPSRAHPNTKVGEARPVRSRVQTAPGTHENHADAVRETCKKQIMTLWVHNRFLHFHTMSWASPSVGLYGPGRTQARLAYPSPLGSGALRPIVVQRLRRRPSARCGRKGGRAKIDSWVAGLWARLLCLAHPARGRRSRRALGAS